MFGAINPLQLMMMKAQQEQMQAAQGMQEAGLNPLMNLNQLGNVLGSVQGVEPHPAPAPPSTVNPDFPRTMSPQFSQNLLRAMAEAAGGKQQTSSLGAILSGRA